VAPRCPVHQQNPDGTHPGRPPGRAAHQVRVGHQSQDGQSTWPHNSAVHLAAGGSGDSMITRRTFLCGLMLGTLAAPLAAEAQAPHTGKVYRIGFLALLPAEDVTLMMALKDRLDELGYVEGKNLVFDYRSAEGRQERLPELAAQLARAHPDVLIAGTGTLAPQALKNVTTTI